MLADRMASHAFCDQHSVKDADPDCPACVDRQAYRMYLEAGGCDYRPAPTPGARTVGLADLPPAEKLGVLHLRTADDGTRYTEFEKDTT
jgi:hypothetical protein